MAAGRSFPSMKLRVGVVQFCPKLGQVQANLRRAKKLTDSIQPGSLDLLCFPEMAFTGYNFSGATAVMPFLEKPRIGPTSVFCSDLAKRLGCYVVAGYPELLEGEDLQQCIQNDQITIDGSDFPERDLASPNSDRERRIVGANSAMLYGPLGEWIGAYRKTNLFRTDKTWVAAGTDFTTFALPPPLNRLTLGICMDLNPFPPADWTLEDGPYELAEYCRSQDTDLLVLLNAWLDPDPEGDDDGPSWSTLQYWAARLRPLWHKADSIPLQSDTTTTVIICNRTGEESGATFAGSSALFQMSQSTGKPKLVDMMTKGEEGVCVWTARVGLSGTP